MMSPLLYLTIDCSFNDVIGILLYDAFISRRCLSRVWSWLKIRILLCQYFSLSAWKPRPDSNTQLFIVSSPQPWRGLARCRDDWKSPPSNFQVSNIHNGFLIMLQTLPVARNRHSWVGNSTPILLWYTHRLFVDTSRDQPRRITNLLVVTSCTRYLYQQLLEVSSQRCLLVLYRWRAVALVIFVSIFCLELSCNSSKEYFWCKFPPIPPSLPGTSCTRRFSDVKKSTVRRSTIRRFLNPRLWPSKEKGRDHVLF